MSLVYCLVVPDKDVNPRYLAALTTSGITIGVRKQGVFPFENMWRPGEYLFDLATAHVQAGKVIRVAVPKDLPLKEMTRVATGLLQIDSHPKVIGAQLEKSRACSRHDGCRLAIIGAPAGDFLASDAERLCAEADRGSVVATTTSTTMEVAA
ncbi:hypothetical protein [uncultured Actinomyces sp.]|uniref:hypothetical protein n=1 Tax=uncultured Actinomyces sp. TaxID=249061 RepID=UPI0028047752|nr:hypothetical protein [uncultured Actinomyces sp.]